MKSEPLLATQTSSRSLQGTRRTTALHLFPLHLQLARRGATSRQRAHQVRSFRGRPADQASRTSSAGNEVGTAADKSNLETVSSGYTKDRGGASISVALADGKTVGDPRTASASSAFTKMPVTQQENGTGDSNRKSLLATQEPPNGLFRIHEGPQCCIYFRCACRWRNGGRPRDGELILLYEPSRTHSLRITGAVYASLHDRHHPADRCCYFFHIVFI